MEKLYEQKSVQKEGKKMKKKILSLLITTLLISSILPMIPIHAATEDEIEQSIIDGIAWLASQQNLDGSWGSYDKTAHTAFVLIKLQDRAYELGYDSPFDPDYPYSEHIVEGWDFIFRWQDTSTYIIPIESQDHTGGASGTMDDPDYDGDGYGVYFADSPGSHPTYTTGITLMALKASGTPNRVNEGGIDVDGAGGADTYQEIAQDAVDYLAYGQGDLGLDEGGWSYTHLDDAGSDWMTDNSNTGYAVLGLAAAEGFGCTVPSWVRTELYPWVMNMQDPVNGDPNDGGSWYRPDWTWVNTLKTGNLIFEMTFLGVPQDSAPFMDAMDYIERHWQDTDYDPGWGYGLAQSARQAMYCLMKGLEYSQIEYIDLDGDTVPEHDWYQEFADVLIAQQEDDGSWSTSTWGNPILDTCWALLTLERVIPPPPMIDVPVDIKPGSWPNPFNKKAKGVFAVAICGTEDFDVTTIDPTSAEIYFDMIDPDGDYASPLWWSYEDAATPYPTPNPDDPEGHALEGDGYMDLVFHFSRQEVTGLMTCDEEYMSYWKLYLTGNLMEEHSGLSFTGFDWIRIQNK